MRYLRICLLSFALIFGAGCKSNEETSGVTGDTGIKHEEITDNGDNTDVTGDSSGDSTVIDTGVGYDGKIYEIPDEVDEAYTYNSRDDFLSVLVDEVESVQQKHKEITVSSKVSYDSTVDRLFVVFAMSDEQIEATFSQKKNNDAWRALVESATKMGNGLLSIEGIGKDVVVQVTTEDEKTAFFIFQSGYVTYTEM